MISSKAPSWIPIALVALALAACSGEQTQQMQGPPDRLTIYVTVEDDGVKGRTVSKLVVQERGRVTFHNKSDGKGDLTLLFRNEKKEMESPFCEADGNGPREKNPYSPIESGASKELTFCRGLKGQFKYEATIGEANAEDPIFFVE